MVGLYSYVFFFFRRLYIHCLHRAAASTHTVRKCEENATAMQRERVGCLVTGSSKMKSSWDHLVNLSRLAMRCTCWLLCRLHLWHVWKVRRGGLGQQMSWSLARGASSSCCIGWDGRPRCRSCRRYHWWRSSWCSWSSCWCRFRDGPVGEPCRCRVRTSRNGACDACRGLAPCCA